MENKRLRVGRQSGGRGAEERVGPDVLEDSVVRVCARGHFLIPPILHVVVLVLSVCANAHMWSSKENFGERIHYKLLGSKSGHQPCNAKHF